MVNRKKAIHKGECGRLAVIAGFSTMEGAGVLVANQHLEPVQAWFICVQINLKQC